MYQKHLGLVATMLLMSGSAAVQALPFNSFDPRTMAMGGAGVAVGDPATAPFFNPALLTASDPSKKYSVEIPIIGARLFDPANMRDNIPALQNDLSALDTAVSTMNTNANSGSASQIALVPGNMNTVATDIDKINKRLTDMSNKPLQGEFGAATVIGVPGKNYGFAFYADAWGAAGGTIEYKDGTTLSNLSTDVKTAANALSGATAISNNATAQAACNAVKAGTGTAADVTTCVNYATTLSNLSSTLNSAQKTMNFNTSSLASKIHLRGVAITETGLSLSHGFVSHDQEWSLGMTPKLMQLQLFDALLSANAGGVSGATGNDYLAKYSAFNFDLGVAKSYSNGWRTGMTVKNVIPQSYDFKRAPTAGATPVATGSTLDINPQARIGVSHENAWSTVALDADLTQNNPAGLESKSQYVSLGGELSALGWAALRAGYRADMLNSDRNITSVGLGLSPRIPYFKFHLDLAYAYNPSEQGGSFRFGFDF